MDAPEVAPDGRPLRVLSLDGGGLRGIFTLRCLAALERECGRPVQDLFDLAVGTSGGLRPSRAGVARARRGRAAVVDARPPRRS